MAQVFTRVVRAVTASPKHVVVSQKRFRSKINIQRPQKLFYERALVTKFTTPYIAPLEDPIPIWESCSKVIKKPKTETKREKSSSFPSYNLAGPALNKENSSSSSYNLARPALNKENSSSSSYNSAEPSVKRETSSASPSISNSAQPPAKKQKSIHPYLRIIARECLERHRASKMTAIFHKNSMTQEEEFEFAVLIHKHQMYIKKYGGTIIKTAFAGTEFQVAGSLYSVSNLTVFSSEVNVQALLKAVKKTPQLTLLAGIIDGKLLSHNDFLKYGKTNLTEARSQLVHTLQMAGGINLNRQLNHHQTTLVSRLQQIGKNETASEENVSHTQEANIDEAKPE